MGVQNNPLLASIEEKYRREYEIKAQLLKAQYIEQLKLLSKQSEDAALMAADDTFDVNAYSAEKFHTAHKEYMRKICHMAAVEDRDDPNLEWTKATVDKRLLQIVGKKNFVPWDDRYFGERGAKDGK